MNANTTTAKLSVLVTPATKRRLEAEARAQKTTVGELVRRRINHEPDSEEQAFLEALAVWGKHAKAVLASVDATYAEFERARAAWPAREAEIRRATLAQLTEADRVALAHIFRAAPHPVGEAQP